MGHLAERCSPELEQLAARVTELERRLSALEIRGKKVVPGVNSSTAEISRQKANKESLAANPFAILGRALLGLAGAYLLRAAFEAGAAPRFAIVAIALLYAWVWLLFSVHAAKRSAKAGALYGITSALIIFPMLWENAVRFKFLPSMVTAAALVVWLVSALLFVRVAAPAFTLWVTVLCVSGTGLGLFVATRDPFPFTVALIVTAALTEWVACRQHWPNLRIAIEIPLDLILCVLAYLATRPGGFPEGYNSVSTSVLLVLFAAPMLVSVGSVAYRTIVLHQQARFWDFMQTGATFAISVCTVLQFAPGPGSKAFGLFGFLTAACCYLEAFLNARVRGDSRNFSFYTVWAGVLFLISSYLVMSPSEVTAWLSLNAILAAALALRTGSVNFALHPMVWLVAVEISSGLLVYAGHLVGGSYPRSIPPMAWMVAISGVACAWILLFPGFDRRGIAVLRCVSVANAALLVAAFGVADTVRAMQAGNSPTAPQLAVTRTVMICLVTLILVLVGSRSNRRELIWMAYLMIGLGTLKLLVEDLRRGSSVSFALSLLAFGVLLAIIPKLMRSERRTNGLPTRD